MQIKIETTNHLTNDEQTAVHHIAQQGEYFKDVQHAAEEVRGWLGNWFVYQGSNHVALHRTKGDTRRVLLITA